MAHAFRYLTLGLCLIAAICTRVHAAAAEQSLRFTVFSAQSAAGLAFVPRPGQPAQAIALYATARSPRYEYRGAMPLRLIDGKSGAVVAEAAVPAAMTDVLLLLVPVSPVPAAGLRYQVFVLDDGVARQTPGSLAVINFSGMELAGTLDGQPLEISAGLNAPKTVGRAAAIVLRTTVKGRSYQAYTGQVALKPNERALLVLLPPFYKGSTEVQSRLLVDAPPRVDAKGAR